MRKHHGVVLSMRGCLLDQNMRPSGGDEKGEALPALRRIVDSSLGKGDNTKQFQ